MPKTKTPKPTETGMAKALSHPLRVKLLTLFGESVASPNELAKKLDEPLTNVSYHVRMLHDLGCIELVDTAPRRGALEHFYRATVQGRVVKSIDVSQLPTRQNGETWPRLSVCVPPDMLEQLEKEVATLGGDNGGFSRGDIVLLALTRWLAEKPDIVDLKAVS